MWVSRYLNKDAALKEMGLFSSGRQIMPISYL